MIQSHMFYKITNCYHANLLYAFVCYLSKCVLNCKEFSNILFRNCVPFYGASMKALYVVFLQWCFCTLCVTIYNESYRPLWYSACNDTIPLGSIDSTLYATQIHQQNYYHLMRYWRRNYLNNDKVAWFWKVYLPSRYITFVIKISFKT